MAYEHNRFRVVEIEKIKFYNLRDAVFLPDCIYHNNMTGGS